MEHFRRLGLAVTGCGQIANLQARMAFREANGLYQAQDWKAAAEKYEEVLVLNPTDPQLLTSYFFLGNSYDNQFKPGRENDPANDAFLTKAIENYKLASERVQENPQIRTLSLQYLVAAYGSDKLNDPSQAEPLLLKMMRGFIRPPPRRGRGLLHRPGHRGRRGQPFGDRAGGDLRSRPRRH